ncbi:TVP38/TMEM64 family protein [Streptococcaceae bacterium ESL0729]|nr:TVP38/TMEM64 family protein [Streptococcaceae bacterium ESL0729]
MKSIEYRQHLVKVISILAILGSLVLGYYLYRLGIFNDDNIIKSTAAEHPFLGALLIIGLQIIQVVVSFLPSGILCASAVLIYGPIQGFLYNYLGIVIGSIILFYLGREFGKPFVQTFVPDKTYNKYLSKVDQGRKFDWFFFWAIFAPLAPDDVLVLVASQTRMSYKFFIRSILIGKIFGVGIYSYVWTSGLEWLQKLF